MIVVGKTHHIIRKEFHIFQRNEKDMKTKKHEKILFKLLLYFQNLMLFRYDLTYYKMATFIIVAGLC